MKKTKDVIKELSKAEKEAQNELALQKAVKNKTLPNLDKKKCEKIILDFQDLVMQIVTVKGLDNYSTPEMLKNFREVKSSVKYGVEDIINAKKRGEKMATQPDNKYVSLDLSTDKKYKL
jgi:hypothetical protein